MSMPKRLSDILAPTLRLTSERGIDVSHEKTNGGHNRVTFSRDGKSRFIIVADSASDHRAMHNITKTAKRELRKMGWL